MSDAMLMLTRCMAAQQANGRVVTLMGTCADCGGESPHAFRGGPAICAMCAIRRSLREGKA